MLHPGTAGSCPGWAARRWRQLAERLRGDGHPVVITEGPADALAMEAFAGCGLPRFAQDLPRLAALLSRARSIAGNSTGPVHLAVALGRPALAVHAPWKSCGAARWGPYHDRGWALVVEHAPARRWSRRRRRRFAARLMDGLGVETVHRAVQSMVASGRPEIGP